MVYYLYKSVCLSDAKLIKTRWQLKGICNLMVVRRRAFNAKMYQIRFRVGLRRKPPMESSQTP